MPILRPRARRWGVRPDDSPGRTVRHGVVICPNTFRYQPERPSGTAQAQNLATTPITLHGVPPHHERQIRGTVECVDELSRRHRLRQRGIHDPAIVPSKAPSGDRCGPVRWIGRPGATFRHGDSQRDTATATVRRPAGTTVPPAAASPTAPSAVDQTPRPKGHPPHGDDSQALPPSRIRLGDDRARSDGLVGGLDRRRRVSSTPAPALYARNALRPGRSRSGPRDGWARPRDGWTAGSASARTATALRAVAALLIPVARG